jgi:polyisoprenoid-binding protein YceI
MAKQQLLAGELINMFRFVCILVTAVAMAATAAAQAGTWQIDPNHSAAQFSVRHLGVSTVRGAFTKVTGSAKHDPADRSKDSLEATIDANSVDTRVEMRDNDLRSAHFLEVQKYPTITFHSKQTKVAGAGKLQITGDLTIHGVTKEVLLEVDGPSAPIKDPWGNQRIGASATTKINRQDFGISGMPGVVGDEITITIDAELIQPQAK